MLHAVGGAVGHGERAEVVVVPLACVHGEGVVALAGGEDVSGAVLGVVDGDALRVGTQVLTAEAGVVVRVEDALLLLGVVRPRRAVLADAVDEFGVLELLVVQADAPQAHRLLGGVQDVLLQVDGHALDLGVLAGIGARGPVGAVGQGEGGGEVEGVLGRVGDAPVVVLEPEQAQAGLLTPGDDHVGVVVVAEGRQAVGGALVVDLGLVGGEDRRGAGRGDVLQRRPAGRDGDRVDGVGADAVAAPVADEGQVRLLAVQFEAVDDVDVVEPAGLGVLVRGRGRGDVLEAAAVESVDVEAGLLQRADDDAAAGIPGVDPHGRVVGVGVASRLVVVHRGGLHGGRDGHGSRGPGGQGERGGQCGQAAESEYVHVAPR